MKIECPNCKTKGDYADNLIPVKGKDICCPGCKTSFHIEKVLDTFKPDKKPKSRLKKIVIGAALAGLVGLGGYFGYNFYQNNNKKEKLKQDLSNYKINNITLNRKNIILDLESNVSEEDLQNLSLEKIANEQATQIGIGFGIMYKLWPKKDLYILVLDDVFGNYKCTFKSGENEVFRKDRAKEMLNRSVCSDKEGQEEKFSDIFAREFAQKEKEEAKAELYLFLNILNNQFVPKMTEIYINSKIKTDFVDEAVTKAMRIDQGTCELWNEDLRNETNILRGIVSPLRNLTNPKLKECYGIFDELLNYERNIRYEIVVMCKATQYSQSTTISIFNSSLEKGKAFTRRAVQSTEELGSCLSQAEEELGVSE